MKPLTPHEYKLAAKLLELAADQFSNHGCNDFDLVKDAELTPDQAYELNRAFTEFNGDADDWSDNELKVSHAIAGDDGMMSFMAARLLEQVNQEQETDSNG